MAPPKPPNLQAARRYIRHIKQELGPTSPRYRAFLNILRGYGSASSSPGELIDRIRDLLDGHEALLDRFRAYLPEGYDDATTRIDGNDGGDYTGFTPQEVILSWIEAEIDLPKMEEISESIHIECTKCKFCNGKRNSIAIETNEPILLCELKGCNREYHLNCLPIDEAGGISENKHILYFDKEPGEGEEELDIPPGEIYCKECVMEGSATVLRQYFTRSEALRKNYSSSRDFVLSLLEKHMTDNPNGNVVDSQGMPVEGGFINEGEEVHLKPPLRSELWYIEEMNRMASSNPFAKDGGASTMIAEDTNKDVWSAAEFLIGKPIRLYCNLDNEYHNGRIIDWRTCSVYPQSKMPTFINKRGRNKDDKTVPIHKLDYYGIGPISSCEFLVKFPAGDRNRRTEVQNWILLEEHPLAIGITLVRGQYDSKAKNSGASPDKWRPAMVLARSALELVPVRALLQEGPNGELFGQKKLEEEERGISNSGDLLALTSFFGKQQDFDVLNLRNEVRGLITKELLIKYGIEKEDSDESAGESEGKEASTTKRRHSIPTPPKLGLALVEYSQQQQCIDWYKAVTLDPSHTSVPEDDIKADESCLEATEAEPVRAYCENKQESKDRNLTADASVQDMDANHTRDSPRPVITQDDDMMEEAVDKASDDDKVANDDTVKLCDGDTGMKPNKDANANADDVPQRAESEAENEPRNESNSNNPVPDVTPSKHTSEAVVPLAESHAGEMEKHSDEGHDKVNLVSDNQSTPVRNNQVRNKDDNLMIGLDIEEECDEGIYGDYDVVEAFEDDDSATSDDMMSYDSGKESIGSYSVRKGTKGVQTAKLSSRRNILTPEFNYHKEKQTLVEVKKAGVDVGQAVQRKPPQRADVSSELKNPPPVVAPAESRKRPAPQSKPEPEPQKPRMQTKIPPPAAPVAKAPAALVATAPAASADKASAVPVVNPPVIFKPPPPGTAVEESESSDDGNTNTLFAQLPRGITMRPSGKWQAQLYYAGKSRYLGVFRNRKQACKAYEVARKYLFSDAQARAATQHSDINFHISQARKAAHQILKNSK